MDERKAQEMIRDAVRGSLTWLDELPSREKEILEKRMELVGVKRRSAFIRKQVLCGYIISLDLSDMKEIVRLMRINSNNLNQYAKKANETGSIYLCDIEQLRTQQEGIWTSIKEILERLANIK